jgi:hypothetical protein
MTNFPLEARLWQQCLANTGEIGSFIAAPGGKEPISPVFADTTELFTWLRLNGWESTGEYLSGRYIKRLRVCHADGSPDNRYSFGYEYCGYSVPMLVVRFCGEMLGVSRDEEKALHVALTHQQGRAS